MYITKHDDDNHKCVLLGEVRSQHIWCDVVSEDILGGRSSRDWNGERHHSLVQRGHHVDNFINVSYLHKWRSQRR